MTEVKVKARYLVPDHVSDNELEFVDLCIRRKLEEIAEEFGLKLDSWIVL